jgi:hypothetical protein
MNADNITRADTIIDEVLARDEFNGGSDRVGVNWLVEIIKKIYKFLEDLFKKFWEWLSKLLEKLHFNFGGAGEGAKTIEVIAKIVIIVLGAAALVLLTPLIIRLLRGRRKKIAELEESEELAAFASDPDAAFQLASFQLSLTDLDIISSSVAPQNLCIVYILKTGGGTVGLTKMFNLLNGESESNEMMAEYLLEQAKDLPFMNVKR